MAKKKKSKRNKNTIKEWGRALGLALILVLIIRGLLFQTYMIETPRMEKTLLTGDYLWVNKLSYGARLPVTLLSVPFFPEVYLDWIQIPPVRLTVFSSIKRNDFLVFNYPGQAENPIDKKELMTKRCVGLPGDTLKISDKQVFINGVPDKNPSTLQFNYRLVTDGTLLKDDFLHKYQISEGGLVSDMGIYDFPLTDTLVSEIKQEKVIRFVRILKDFPGENTQYVFPMGHYFSFNKDNFGPVVVPFKGQQLSLDTRSVELYRAIIENYEGNTLEVKNSKVYLNGKETTSYTIKQNYYFVMDDNRDNAKDSRYWGFLPQSYIVGKASKVLFSFDKHLGKIRWNRTFKDI